MPHFIALNETDRERERERERGRRERERERERERAKGMQNGKDSACNDVSYKINEYNKYMKNVQFLFSKDSQNFKSNFHSNCNKLSAQTERPS